jgi:hypothetical protein
MYQEIGKLPLYAGDDALTPFHVLPSDPDAPTLYLLADMIARYTNAALFWDLRDMAEAERLAEVATLKAMFEELIH